MRKDEIEDRIIRLEQDMRELRSDHRQGVDEILTEMRTFQKYILEEKIDSIRQQLSCGYENFILDLLLNNAEKNFKDNCQKACKNGIREECREVFRSRLHDVIAASGECFLGKPDFPDDASLIMQKPFLKEPPCDTCFNAYRHEKELLIESCKRLKDRKESILLKERRSMFISDLPINSVVSSFLEPLSHEIRFMMIRALTTGSMTFKELGELTGSKGGHLIYHLNILIDAGFIIKTDAGKRYSITDRGIGVMDLIRKMYVQNTDPPCHDIRDEQVVRNTGV